jgi:hypothetical protein
MNPSPKRVNPTPSSVPVNDPRYPIWGRLFLCRVPRIAYYSTGYLEDFGMHSSGNQNVDRELAKQPQLVYITVNDMIEHFNQSQRISIVKQEDVKTVYEICQDYTFNFGDRLNREVFAHDVPFGDLIKIDEFAEAVYQYAGHEYGEDFARTFLPDNVMKDIVDLNAMFAAIDNRISKKAKAKEDHYTVNNIYSPNQQVKVQEEKKTDEERVVLPARPSMRDLFMSYMDNSGMGGRL